MDLRNMVISLGFVVLSHAEAVRTVVVLFHRSRFISYCRDRTFVFLTRNYEILVLSR